VKKKQSIKTSEIVSDKTFDLLIDSTLKGLKTNDYYQGQCRFLLTKPELLDLVRSFHPHDSIELLLIFQFLIGHLWSAEKLSHGYSFGDFSNLSLKAADLLIRYKAVKMKKSVKNDIPHEEEIDITPQP
jgi:hypothetical protein